MSTIARFIFITLVSALVLYVLAVFAPDILNSFGGYLSSTAFGKWMIRHDTTLDLITVWGMAVGFLLFGITKTLSWWTLLRQDDATMVGVTLKRQKLVEALIGYAMAIFYGMALSAYYADRPIFGFWDRFTLRAGLTFVMFIGTYYCIKFVYHLRREVWSPSQLTPLNTRLKERSYE